MNYFELYPGDYLRDTTRLSLLEHGVYLRLLMTYYAEESPLPSPFSELFTIAGAGNLADRNAVKKVAEKFFPIGDDGLRHNNRADEEITKAQDRMDSQPDDRKATQAERAKRYRDRRSAMFKLLREHGIVLDFNAKAEELEAAVMALASRHSRDGERDDSRDESDDVQRDVTASRPQTPDPITKASTPARTTETPTRAASPTEAGRACLLMRQAGCVLTNPNHPDLLAALAEGVIPEALASTAAEAVEAGKAKPFAWAIATARSRYAEGAKALTTGEAHGTPARTSVLERAEAEIARRRAERAEHQ